MSRSKSFANRLAWMGEEETMKQPCVRRLSCGSLRLVLAAFLWLSASSVNASAEQNPAPERNAERVVLIHREQSRIWSDELETWRRNNQVFAGVAFYSFHKVHLKDPSEKDRGEFLGAHVSPSFFTVLSVHPFLGRVFREDEFKIENDVIMLGHPLWKRLGSDRNIIGKTLWGSWQGSSFKSYTVIGVVPPGFEFPPGAAFFMPDPTGLPSLGFRLKGTVRPIARLKSSVSIRQAQAEMTRLAQQTDEERGAQHIPVTLFTLSESIANGKAAMVPGKGGRVGAKGQIEQD